MRGKKKSFCSKYDLRSLDVLISYSPKSTYIRADAFSTTIGVSLSLIVNIFRDFY